MRNTARLLTLTVLAAAGTAALGAARPPESAAGGVIKVRFTVTSTTAGQPVDGQASVAEGIFTDGDREARSRVLRADGAAAVVAELTHHGRVVIESRNGPVRVVATYAEAPPGTRVSEARWRALQVAQSGTRIEFERAGSFVGVKAAARAASGH